MRRAAPYAMSPASSPTPQQLLLAGTTDGLYLFAAETRGQEWHRRGPFLTGWQVDSVLGLPWSGDARLLAGVSRAGASAVLNQSDDLARTWGQLPALHYTSALAARGATVQRIWQLMPGADGHTLYAGVEDAGLFTSRDSGVSWHSVDALNLHPSRHAWQRTRGGLALHSIAVHPSDPQRLWVAISGAGLFRTADGGASWTACDAGLPTAAAAGATATLSHKLVADPRTPDTLYLQHFHGPYRSRDGGDSWQPIGTGLPSRFGFPLAIAPDGALYAVPLESAHARHAAGGRLRVYRSRDQGDSWQPLQQGLAPSPTASVLRDALTTDTLSPRCVYLATSTGDLYASFDGGDTWMFVASGLPRITCLHAATLLSF